MESGDIAELAVIELFNFFAKKDVPVVNTFMALSHLQTLHELLQIVLLAVHSKFLVKLVCFTKDHSLQVTTIWGLTA